MSPLTTLSIVALLAQAPAPPKDVQRIRVGGQRAMAPPISIRDITTAPAWSDHVEASGILFIVPQLDPARLTQPSPGSAELATLRSRYAAATAALQVRLNPQPVFYTLKQRTTDIFVSRWLPTGEPNEETLSVGHFTGIRALDLSFHSPPNERQWIIGTPHYAAGPQGIHYLWMAATSDGKSAWILIGEPKPPAPPIDETSKVRDLLAKGPLQEHDLEWALRSPTQAPILIKLIAETPACGSYTASLQKFIREKLAYEWLGERVLSAVLAQRIEFEDAALASLEAGRAPRACLWYLGETVTSERRLNRLRNAKVKPEDEIWKQDAIFRIEHRK